MIRGSHPSSSGTNGTNGTNIIGGFVPESTVDGMGGTSPLNSAGSAPDDHVVVDRSVINEYSAAGGGGSSSIGSNSGTTIGRSVSLGGDGMANHGFYSMSNGVNSINSTNNTAAAAAAAAGGSSSSNHNHSLGRRSESLGHMGPGMPGGNTNTNSSSGSGMLNHHHHHVPHGGSNNPVPGSSGGTIPITYRIYWHSSSSTPSAPLTLYLPNTFGNNVGIECPFQKVSKRPNNNNNNITGNNLNNNNSELEDYALRVSFSYLFNKEQSHYVSSSWLDRSAITSHLEQICPPALLSLSTHDSSNSTTSSSSPLRQAILAVETSAIHMVNGHVCCPVGTERMEANVSLPGGYITIMASVAIRNNYNELRNIQQQQQQQRPPPPQQGSNFNLQDGFRMDSSMSFDGPSSMGSIGGYNPSDTIIGGGPSSLGSTNSRSLSFSNPWTTTTTTSSSPSSNLVNNGHATNNNLPDYYSGNDMDGGMMTTSRNMNGGSTSSSSSSSRNARLMNPPSTTSNYLPSRYSNDIGLNSGAGGNGIGVGIGVGVGGIHGLSGSLDRNTMTANGGTTTTTTTGHLNHSNHSLSSSLDRMTSTRPHTTRQQQQPHPQKRQQQHQQQQRSHTNSPDPLSIVAPLLELGFSMEQCQAAVQAIVNVNNSTNNNTTQMGQQQQQQQQQQQFRKNEKLQHQQQQAQLSQQQQQQQQQINDCNFTSSRSTSLSGEDILGYVLNEERDPTVPIDGGVGGVSLGLDRGLGGGGGSSGGGGIGKQDTHSYQDSLRRGILPSQVVEEEDVMHSPSQQRRDSIGNAVWSQQQQQQGIQQQVSQQQSSFESASSNDHGRGGNNGTVWGNAGKLKLIKSVPDSTVSSTSTSTVVFGEEWEANGGGGFVGSSQDQQQQQQQQKQNSNRDSKVIRVLDIPPEMNAFVFHCNAQTRNECLERHLFG